MVLQNVYAKRSRVMITGLLPANGLMCGKFALKKVGSRVKTPWGGPG
jgi:hypothetical protein